MAEFSPLEVSAWIKKLGPNFKKAITPFGLSCIFPYHQIKVDEPFLCAVANFWILTRHVFHLHSVEICPTLEEFSAILGEPKVNTLVFPTMGGDLPILIQAPLGVSLDTAKHWCIFGKLNIHLIFAYFSRLTVPMIDRPHSHYLNAFYLCVLARYFLVHGTNCVDHSMYLVVSNLRSGNLAGMILSEILNGLDAFHRKEANFFVGSPLLL